jgi:hypothetical protein
MQTRRRVPTVFNIYMLDVICCALGCVVLLWQVSHQEAEQQTAAAEQARVNYERASKEVLSASTEASQLKATLVASEAKARQLAIDLETSRALAAARLQEHEKSLALLSTKEDALKKLRGELADAAETQRKMSVAVADKDKLSAALKAQLATTEKKASELEKEVAAQQRTNDSTARRLREQQALLQDAEARNKKLDNEASELRGDAKETQAKLTIAQLRMKLVDQDLQRARKDLVESGQRYKDLMAAHDNVSKQLAGSAKDLALARATLANLEEDKSKLESEAALLLARAREMQALAEQRFAGIELKGENVVFLVDMSGSMDLIDSQTQDPDKWPKVCEVVARLMRSLAGLKRYQVILFSDRPRYLFGHEGQWLKYEPASSADAALETLKRTKPKGETNLHLAFTEAFRYRPLGLDTIYLLSDGLPNAGEGLPADAVQLSDAKRSEILSRNLRQKLRTDWNRPLADSRRVHINTIGFFFESPDVGAFLWALAREQDGSFVGMSKP